jgi:beta-glucanase (GH16 family)
MRFGLFVSVLIGITACSPPDAKPWTLRWVEQFNGPEGSEPDPSTWVHDVGGDGWGNSQLEYNTDRTDNVDLDGNGFLRITARREAYEDNSWTSGRLTTHGLESFAYGRIEARILLPAGKGLWPAFWMLGQDFADVGWPTCGEIDILELRGETPNELLGTVHGPGYSGGSSVGQTWVTEQDLTDDFHIYAVEWDPRHISWWLDDALIGTVHPGDLPAGTPWVFDHDFFILLNLAVGGNFLEEPDETTPDVAVMGVDYVKVFERTEPLYDPFAP